MTMLTSQADDIRNTDKTMPGPARAFLLKNGPPGRRPEYCRQ